MRRLYDVQKKLGKLRDLNGDKEPSPDLSYIVDRLAAMWSDAMFDGNIKFSTHLTCNYKHVAVRAARRFKMDEAMSQGILSGLFSMESPYFWRLKLREVVRPGICFGPARLINWGECPALHRGCKLCCNLSISVKANSSGDACFADVEEESTTVSCDVEEGALLQYDAVSPENWYVEEAAWLHC